MSKKITKATLWIMKCFLASSILAAEEPLDLSGPVEAKITEILKVKEEAMQFSSMRSKDGVLGKRTESLMNELGEMIIDPELIRKLQMREGEDMSAKIALWSVDRKNRPDEYNRFSKYYVNKPMDDELIEYFSRPLLKQDPDPFAEPRESSSYIPRPGTWYPNPVDEEDQVEKNRLIMEYCYFMPPTGEAFDHDIWRGQLSKALCGMAGFEKTFIVWKVDLKMTLDAPPTDAERTRGAVGNVYGSIQPFVDIASRDSLKVLAGHWDDTRARKAMEWQLLQSWWPLKPQPLDESRYEEAKKRYDAWQALAREKWETPHEKSFAEWLLAQPAPPIPPPPQYADGPNDPFLPPRPPGKNDKE